MKGMLVSSMLVLAIGTAGMFVLKRPDGQPWLSTEDFTPDVSSAQSALKKLGGDHAQVYRWKDAQGNWHLSDTPPTEGSFEQVEVNPDTNLVQGLAPAPAQSTTQPPVSAPAIPLPMTVSPGQAKKLLDDARGVQQIMDERQQQLDRY